MPRKEREKKGLERKGEGVWENLSKLSQTGKAKKAAGIQLAVLLYESTP